MLLLTDNEKVLYDNQKVVFYVKKNFVPIKIVKNFKKCKK